jgi:hypothetical protein
VYLERWKTTDHPVPNAVILPYHGVDNDHDCAPPLSRGPKKPEADHPPLDPPVADQAPHADEFTGYDYEHLVTYLRLLDAEADGAEWAEVTRIVLHIDASDEPERARRAFRAIWRVPNG